MFEVKMSPLDCPPSNAGYLMTLAPGKSLISCNTGSSDRQLVLELFARPTATDKSLING